MGILLIAFLAIALLVVGSAWKRLRSNWRSIQSMRSDNEGAADVVLDIDVPEGSDVHNHHGHGHGGFDGGGGHH
jgi:hypothetical protein